MGVSLRSALSVLTAAVAIAGCAKLVGMTGDYEEEPSNGGRTSGGAGGSERGGGGGDDTGGTSGSAGETAGSSGDAGTGTGGAAASGGTSGAGTGGNVTSGGTGGAVTGGDGGTAGDGTGGSGGSSGGPPSCSELESTCGADRDSDCCESAYVFGDSFNRYVDSVAYPAEVSDFRLDLYEVTVGRFRTFVDATDGLYRPEPGSGKNPNNQDDPGWDPAFNDDLPVNHHELVGPDGLVCDLPALLYTWTDEPEGNESRPINCVSWYLAFAFCIWDGGRLPTEAEWHFVAAGGSQERFYPWSSPANEMSIDPSRGSYQDLNAGTCVGDGMFGCALTDLIPVGSKPNGRGRFGHSDLGGNVYEWSVDTMAPYPAECDDCANFSDGQRIARGGGYITVPGLIENEFRQQFEPGSRSSAVGIRCARAP